MSPDKRGYLDAFVPLAWLLYAFSTFLGSFPHLRSLYVEQGPLRLFASTTAPCLFGRIIGRRIE